MRLLQLQQQQRALEQNKVQHLGFMLLFLTELCVF